MNRVKERCLIEKNAKFYYASNRLFFELKIIKIILYFLAVVPVLITALPQIKTNPVSNVICTIVSFSITLINEAMSSFTSSHKDSAICSLQLYETGITASTYSKVEYDRELTNELNELAIRRGIPAMQKQDELHTVDVPQDISDDYSYLYICRINAATNKYLLSRMVYIYIFVLIAIVVAFVGAIFLKTETEQYLILLIGFYPLISPIIKDLSSCKECIKDCSKLAADIDNYFADGDDTVERLARIYYYIQQLEFEMFSSRPVIFKIFKKIFARGVEVLQVGVTTRFESSIVELKQKSLINKGLISTPKGKSLITKKEFDLEQLKKIEKEKKVIKVKKVDNNVVKSTVVSKPKTTTKKTNDLEPKTTVKKTTTSKPKTTTTTKKTTTAKKTTTTKNVK